MKPLAPLFESLNTDADINRHRQTISSLLLFRARITSSIRAAIPLWVRFPGRRSELHLGIAVWYRGVHRTVCTQNSKPLQQNGNRVARLRGPEFAMLSTWNLIRPTKASSPRDDTLGSGNDHLYPHQNLTQRAFDSESSRCVDRRGISH